MNCSKKSVCVTMKIELYRNIGKLNIHSCLYRSIYQLFIQSFFILINFSFDFITFIYEFIYFNFTYLSLLYASFDSLKDLVQFLNRLVLEVLIILLCVIPKRNEPN